MTDYTARAVELLTVESSSATIRVHAGIGYAILALTDALAGRVQRPRWDDDLRETPWHDYERGEVTDELQRVQDLAADRRETILRLTGERDRLREGIRDIADRWAERGETPTIAELRALLADDPTHRGPITVGGKTSEEPGSGATSPYCEFDLCGDCTGDDRRAGYDVTPCAHACHRAPKEGQG